MMYTPPAAPVATIEDLNERLREAQDNDPFCRAMKAHLQGETIKDGEIESK